MTCFARGWLLRGLSVQLGALLIVVPASPTPLPTTEAVVLLGGTGTALNPLLVNGLLTFAEPTVLVNLVNTVQTSAITLGVAAATAVGSRAIAGQGGDLTGTVTTGGFTVAAIAIAATTRDTPGEPVRQ